MPDLCYEIGHLCVIIGAKKCHFAKPKGKRRMELNFKIDSDLITGAKRITELLGHKTGEGITVYAKQGDRIGNGLLIPDIAPEWVIITAAGHAAGVADLAETGIGELLVDSCADGVEHIKVFQLT